MERSDNNSGLPILLSLAIPQGEPWDSGILTAQILLNEGYQVYAAGGCVRDLLLGLPDRPSFIY